MIHYWLDIRKKIIEFENGIDVEDDFKNIDEISHQVFAIDKGWA